MPRSIAELTSLVVHPGTASQRAFWVGPVPTVDRESVVAKARAKFGPSAKLAWLDHSSRQLEVVA